MQGANSHRRDDIMHVDRWVDLFRVASLRVPGGPMQMAFTYQSDHARVPTAKDQASTLGRRQAYLRSSHLCSIKISKSRMDHLQEAFHQLMTLGDSFPKWPDNRRGDPFSSCVPWKSGLRTLRAHTSSLVHPQRPLAMTLSPCAMIMWGYASSTTPTILYLP